MSGFKILSNKLRAISPSSEIQHKNRKHLFDQQMILANRLAEFNRSQREARAAYRKALDKLLSESGTQHLPSGGSFSSKIVSRDLAGQTSGQTSKSSSFPHPRGVPLDTQVMPLVGWVIGTPSTNTNNGSGSGDWGGNWPTPPGPKPTDVFLGLNAGTVETFGGGQPGGGSATVWGYVGQYLQAVDQRDWTAALMTANANINAAFDPSWSVTNYFSVFSENANLVFVANILFLIYDAPSWQIREIVCFAALADL